MKEKKSSTKILKKEKRKLEIISRRHFLKPEKRFVEIVFGNFNDFYPLSYLHGKFYLGHIYTVQEEPYIA